MGIYVARQKEHEDWNRFVAQEKGSIYHLWQWGEIIERTLKYQKLFLIARNDKNEIKGILPLYFKDNIKGGKLVSIPSTCFAGIITRNTNTNRNLLNFALNWAKEYKAQIEMNSLDKLDDSIKRLSLKTSNLADYILKTNGSYVEYINSISSTRRRKRIRRLAKTKINIVKARPGDVSDFYNMHSQMLKNMGIRVSPINLFELTYKELKKETFIIKSVLRGEVKAYMWSFIYGRKLYIWKNAYIRGPSRDSVYLDLLLAKNIELACSSKTIEEIDYSCAWTNTGLAEYKMKWGFSPRIIYVFKTGKYKNQRLSVKLRQIISGKTV